MPIANHEKWSYIHNCQATRTRYTTALLLGTDFPATVDNRLAIVDITYRGVDSAAYVRISIDAYPGFRYRLYVVEES